MVCVVCVGSESDGRVLWCVLGVQCDGREYGLGVKAEEVDLVSIQPRGSSTKGTGAIFMLYPSSITHTGLSSEGKSSNYP